MGTSTSRSGNYAPSGREWSKAKGSMTRFTAGTGSSVEAVVQNYISAVRDYSSNKNKGTSGGGRGKGALSPSIKAGQELIHFLSGIAAEGLDKTLKSIGLGHLVNAAPNEVFIGIVDRICKDGSLLDDATARSAVTEVLSNIFDESDDAYAELRERWDSKLDVKYIIELMTLFLAQAIFQKILSDLGERIESNAQDAKKAEEKEKDIFEFIKEMVKFKLGDIDPLNYDWQGPQGRALLQQNIEAALAQLEG